MRRLLCTAGIACALASAPAVARDFYYFHKANVTLEAFQRDRLQCERLMSGARRSPSGPAYVPDNNLSVAQNAAVAGIAGLFEGMMLARERRRTIDSIERTCMADKGYHRYRVSDELAAELWDIDDPEERLARYLAMAAADEPVGERMVE
jgi:hypothetical protein